MSISASYPSTSSEIQSQTLIGRCIERISNACAHLDNLESRLSAELNKLGAPPTETPPQPTGTKQDTSGSATLVVTIDRLDYHIDRLERTLSRGV